MGLYLLRDVDGRRKLQIYYMSNGLTFELDYMIFFFMKIAR